MARLADVSLHDPVSISVLDEGHGQANPQGAGALEASPPENSDELDSFAIPEGLDQHVTLVPSKLRLVSLAAFILQKCAVGLGTGPGLVKGTVTCSCRAQYLRGDAHTHEFSSQGVCIVWPFTPVSQGSRAVGKNQRSVRAGVFSLRSALSISSWD